MSKTYSAHDQYIKTKLQTTKQKALELDEIMGVDAFDGLHNPAFRSATSHRIWFSYETAANNFRPKWTVTESAGEAAVAMQGLMHKDLYGIDFQPLTVYYKFDGENTSHTYDMMMTKTNGHRRLVFVRNGASLARSKTWREIREIIRATPKNAADDLIFANTDNYPRQRRENVFRMFGLMQDKDPEADDLTLKVAQKLRTLYRMADLFPVVDIPQYRVFRASHRLLARGYFKANLNHVFHEHSRLEVA